MKRIHPFAVACLTLLLGASWAGEAKARVVETPMVDIQLTVVPSENLSHVEFLYGTIPTNPEWDINLVPTSLPDLVGGVTNTLTFSTHEPEGDPHAFVYGLIAVYDTGNQLLALGFNDGEAQSLIGSPRSFETEFAGYTEADLSGALMDNNWGGVEPFARDTNFLSTAGIRLGESGKLINFSDSSDGGFILATVPEPSAFVLSAAGAIFLGAYAWRRRKLAA